MAHKIYQKGQIGSGLFKIWRVTGSVCERTDDRWVYRYRGPGARKLRVPVAGGNPLYGALAQQTLSPYRYLFLSGLPAFRETPYTREIPTDRKGSVYIPAGCDRISALQHRTGHSSTVVCAALANGMLPRSWKEQDLSGRICH